MQVQPSLITPGDAFDVFYFLRNPLDLTTYYIKAVLYDVRNGEQITTVTLTRSSVNSHLYFATLQAPPDPSAMGRNIVAIASVYTDSGYTTKSDAYEEQESYFLVKSVLPFVGGGGGVDYSKLREIMEEVARANKTETPDMPFDALFGAIGTLQREINRIPKDLVDLSGIAQSIDAVRQAVADLPEPEKLDLQPVIAEMKANSSVLLRAIEALPEPLQAKVNEATENLKKVGTAIIEAIERASTKAATQIVSQATKALDRELGQKQITLSIGDVAQSQDKEPQPSPVDISHLMKQ